MAAAHLSTRRCAAACFSVPRFCSYPCSFSVLISDRVSCSGGLILNPSSVQQTGIVAPWRSDFFYFYHKMEVSKMYPKGCSLAFEALMKETPYNHYDSGCDGICPECRSCCFHRPHWKYQSCVFDECPYYPVKLSTRRAAQDEEKES